jgi:hypothetical protein
MGSTNGAHDKRVQPTGIRAFIGALLLVAAIGLLIASTFVDGVGARTWLAAGIAVVGAILGYAVPYARAIFIDAIRHPTRDTVLEFRNGDSRDVRVRVVDDPHSTLAHPR